MCHIQLPNFPQNAGNIYFVSRPTDIKINLIPTDNLQNTILYIVYK